VPPLTVESATPILLYGEQDQIQGEVWLSNTTGADIGVSGGSVLVNFPTPETGTISFPPNAAVPAGATRRLALKMAVQLVASPGSYPATITLDTITLNTAGSQAIPATAVVASVFLPALGPGKLTFTGVTSSATLNGSVIVRNRGNVPIVVNAIPDETLVEVVVFPSVLSVGTSGSVSVAPAPGPSTGGTVTFTNNTPTIDPGDWAQVDFALTTPAAMTADRHFRILPRIASQRFVVDLLT
jgi:hypothetical protein